MKYAILTFGCRTNQADSFALDRDLRERGGEESEAAHADVVVVNTCAVTATAEQAARQAIRRVARMNPSARIVATGCYATRQPGDFASLPVSQTAPNDAISELATTGLKPCSISASQPCSTCQIDAEGSDRRTIGPSDFRTAGVVRDVGPELTLAAALCGRERSPMPGPGTRGRTMHLLRVQTGCNERCTYCIVPITRGRSRSTPPQAAMSEVRDAVAAGFKETMITGVHLGCYGRDLQPATGLADLIRRLTGLLAAEPRSQDARLRLSAIEPMDLTDELIHALADSRRVVPHFHLPLQHASDRILSAMARPYTTEQFRQTVAKVLARFPDASVGTDLIVGFPGETERDFEECAAYLAESRLAYVHVFPFSPRPGTSAATLTGRPPGMDVRRRTGELRAIAADLNGRFRARFVGTVREALTIEDGTLALTDNYLRVRIPAGLARNDRIKVRIERDGEPMSGCVVSAEHSRQSA